MDRLFLATGYTIHMVHQSKTIVYAAADADVKLTQTPVVNGTFHWFMGDKRVGWIAGDDLAAVSARVLGEGPEKHASKQ